MTTMSDAPLTSWLAAWRAGDGRAFGALIDVCHERLRGMAEERIRRDSVTASFNATDLLHQAVLQVLEAAPDLRNRAHFFATMSLAMRSILIDLARARSADKRGGGDVRVTLTSDLAGAGDSWFELMSLDQALHELSVVDSRSADVLHLSWFAGLKHDEIADVLQVSVKTVERDLKYARAFVHEALDGR